jgi:recombinational DNA repair protein RecR
MSPCCGRPDNRQVKNKSYNERFAYLSSHQINKAQLSTCKECAALTSGDPCTICGKSKIKEDEENKA